MKLNSWRFWLFGLLLLGQFAAAQSAMAPEAPSWLSPQSGIHIKKAPPHSPTALPTFFVRQEQKASTTNQKK
ncbi:hypothetical protein D6821_01345 [Candidatus Parcubacteria bacterium]|nr:MAG: hypothetical protein D6821_01345 [Candidatus Parcubacteria bacterium]